MVETMVNWGVTHVFGMVGHSNLGFADAMRVAEQRGDLSFIGIRHEGAAAFAAVAYGKLTGKLAGCFAIAGPGSTNLMTGLYDAKTDRAPVLALSGQVPSKTRGRGAFQDTDLALGVPRRRPLQRDRPGRLQPRRADDPRLQDRTSSNATSPTSSSPTRCRSSPRPTVAKVGGPDGRTGRSPHRPAGRCARRSCRPR